MRTVLLLAILLVAAGCASLSQDLDRAFGERTGLELTETPFFAQEQYQCGPAALATVLVANGVSVNPEQLAPAVFTPGRRGSLQQDLIGSVRSAGRVPYLIDPALDALFDAIGSGHPVLVLQNLGIGWWSQWHYAVVIGFDPERKRILLRSGTEQRRETRVDTFFNTWARGDFWGLIVLSPDNTVEQLDQGRYFQSIAALEAVGQHAAALQFWTAAEERWSGAPVPLLGRANTLLALGEYQRSASIYERLLANQQFPSAVSNNLAYSWAKLGRFTEALELLDAELTNPSSSEVLQAMRETRAEIRELQRARTAAPAQ